MHVYGQYTYHSPAEIRGTRKALETLRAALDQALEAGEGSCIAFAADGEGFRVNVVQVNLISSLGSPEYSAESEHRILEDLARRERRKP